MKKALLISCFHWYRGRLEYVEKYFKNNGYDVQIWMSDYLHFQKRLVDEIEGCNYIHVYPYKKNMSFARLYSHYGFAKKISEVLFDEKPDLIVANIPPNSVAWACGSYKKQNPQTKLVFDIIDMWPESYTSSKFLKTPFKLWAGLRDKNLEYADVILTECELYQNFLNQTLKERMSTLHMCRPSEHFTEIPEWNGECIDIGYLGSINNLIDIDFIEKLLQEMAQVINIRVHIVGGGEKKETFIQSLKRTSAIIEDHGVVFDTDLMRSIIGKCHFAINMMKPTVCVGLTIKSMDYFQIGVPFLNTIKGDTAKLIDEYHCGWNIDNVSLCKERIRLLTRGEYEQMRLNTQKVFWEKFSITAFVRIVEELFKTII